MSNQIKANKVYREKHNKFTINFLADKNLVDDFDKKLIDDKLKGQRRYKDRTAFFVKKMKDYIK